MAFVQDGELTFSEYLQKTGFWQKIKNFFGSVKDRFLGTGLTGAEHEANTFTHNERLESQEFNEVEAQKSRDFTEYMTRNKYQMETASMESAGLNPAMVYGGGSLVPTAANGAAASSSSGSSVSPNDLNPLDLILTLIRFPKEMDELKAQIDERRASADMNRDLGAAALINAVTNRINAGTSQGELGVHQRLADLREVEVQVGMALADSNISVNEEEKKRIAEETLRIQKERSVIDRYIDVAEKNADSQQKHAIAALRNAEASVQNAATNDRLADYQTSLMYSSELLNYYEGDNKQIVNRYLNDRQIAELEKIKAEGLKVTKEGKLIDKQGNLVTAQTIKTYVNCGTDIANSVSRFVGISALSSRASSIPSSSPKVSPDMLYGNYGTFYE